VAGLQGREKKFDDNFICFNTILLCCVTDRHAKTAVAALTHGVTRVKRKHLYVCIAV